MEQADGLNDKRNMKAEDDIMGTRRRTNLTFAAPQEARSIVTRPDDYILCMHPLERAAAMGSTAPVSQDAYLRFLAENVLAWTEAERHKLKAAMRMLDAWFCGSHIKPLDTLVFVKTTGDEMWNCAYTRSNSIVLPEGKLAAYENPAKLSGLLAHEWFHIRTRLSPGLRTDLYRLTGFHPLEDKDFCIPEIVKRRMLTNPDAPHHDHYVSLSFEGQTIQAVPITMLKAQTMTVDPTKDILDSLQTRMLVIGRKQGSWAPIGRKGRPHCLDLSQVTGWQGYVGNGEVKVFDPEEILADCFVRLLAGENVGPEAKIGRSMISIFAKHAALEKQKLTKGGDTASVTT